MQIEIDTARRDVVQLRLLRGWMIACVWICMRNIRSEVIWRSRRFSDSCFGGKGFPKARRFDSAVVVRTLVVVWKKHYRVVLLCLRFFQLRVNKAFFVCSFRSEWKVQVLCVNVLCKLRVPFVVLVSWNDAQSWTAGARRMLCIKITYCTLKCFRKIMKLYVNIETNIWKLKEKYKSKLRHISLWKACFEKEENKLESEIKENYKKFLRTFQKIIYRDGRKRFRGIYNKSNLE